MIDAFGLALTWCPTSKPATDPIKTKSRRNPSTKINGPPALPWCS